MRFDGGEDGCDWEAVAAEPHAPVVSQGEIYLAICQGVLMTFPITPSIRSRLTDDEHALRKALLHCLVGEQGPVPFAAAGAVLAWPPARTAAVGAALAAKKLAVLDEQGHVKYAYPVSSVPTDHRVTLDDGRTLYAMCAIDALGCFFTFEQPVQIDARCHVCGEPVHIIVRGLAQVESQPPEVCATHVDLSKYEDWASNT
jgi:hypothetical protein